MGKANEERMSDLHGQVAESLTEILAEREDVVTYDDDGNEVPTGKTKLTAAPSYFTAAITFLNNNKVTMDKKVNNNMNRISDLIGEKQNKSRLGDPKAAAADGVH